MIEVYNRYDRENKKYIKGLVKKILHLNTENNFFIKILKKRKFYKVIKKFDEYEKNDQIPLFNAVEIETINRCNGTCPFCPVNKNSDKREFLKMEEELFYKIINELSELQYKGNLALFSNNEPFLDERIIDFAIYAKEKLHNAHIYMYTNATLLSIDRYKRIIPYLDHLHIDNYSDTLTLIKPVREIVEDSKIDTTYDEKTVVHLRKIHEVLSSRGGQAPNKKVTEKTIDYPCLLPYQQLIIRPDGKISLCCNDVYGTHTLGDVSKESLYEIWTSTKYAEIRKKIAKSRENDPLCKNCDWTFGRTELIDGVWNYEIS